jgi:hypothetical protein
LTLETIFDLFIQIFHINGIMHNVAFCVWLLRLSLKIEGSSFIVFHDCIRYHCVYTLQFFSYLFIHHLMTIWDTLAIVSSAMIALLWTWLYLYMYLSEHLFPTLLDTHPGAELLGHMALWSLRNHWKVFLSLNESFYIPTSNEWKFQILYYLTNTCYFPFLNPLDFFFFFFWSLPAFPAPTTHNP